MKKILILLIMALSVSISAQTLNTNGDSANNPLYSVNTPPLGSTDIATDSILKLIQKRINDSLRTSINVLNLPDSLQSRKSVEVSNFPDSLQSRKSVEVSNFPDSTKSRKSIEVSNFPTNSKTILTNGEFSPSVKIGNVASTDTALTVQIKSETVNYYTATTPTATGLVVQANATDFATLRGSATKTLYVTKIIIESTAGTVSVNNIALFKRSTTNTGGTSTVATIVPFDSNSPASTGEVRFYTANPTALGTLIGAIAARKQKVTVTTSVTGQSFLELDFTDNPIVLRGNTQLISLNYNSSSATNSSAISFQFYEK